MTNVVSALTARTQLGQIIKRATQKNERFVIDRRGQPSVIIMSIKDYIDTMAPAPAELRAMQQRAKKTGLNRLSMRQIDNIIAEVRSEQPAKKTTKRQRK
jgi:prevent-host-death family protein